MAKVELSQLPKQLHEPLKGVVSRVDDLCAVYANPDSLFNDREIVRDNLAHALIEYTIAVIQVAERK